MEVKNEALLILREAMSRVNSLYQEKTGRSVSREELVHLWFSSMTKASRKLPESEGI
jgi:hypothetical protein